ncbi:MAG: DoxX family membrane protein [Alphaproteobacteria bacterium]|nr:DoxX family membrane protein [Alphaproteobacteria bacterium]
MPKPLQQIAVKLAARILPVLEWLANIVLLAVRLWMARVFFLSGLTKLESWDNTLFLFTHEYAVPFLPPAIAAAAGTLFELACPVLLTLGLGTRLAALPLLAMTAVIQFTYISHTDHLYWALLLAALLCIGPGRVSIDHLIRRKYMP